MTNLATRLRALDPDQRATFYESCTPHDWALIEADLAELEHTGQQWTPLPHQQPPEGKWRTWMLHGSRSCGKTDALASWVAGHVSGPPCDRRVPGGHRVIAISPTIGDAISALAAGPSSIIAHLPGAKLRNGLVGNTGGVYIIAPNGAQIRLTGAYVPEDDERLRAAGNTCAAVCDELAVWRRPGVWRNMKVGLRLGKQRRTVVATTPRRQKLYLKLLENPRVVRTHATIDDNPHLDPDYRAEMYDEFGGTRFARQELEGLLLEDVEGALWSWALIETARAGTPSGLARVAVGVDPSGSEEGDETGIVAAGVDDDGTLWVLEDSSTRGTPGRRYKAAVDLAVRHQAGEIVYEHTYGGDNIAAGITQAWKDHGTGIMPRLVKASAQGGKQGRALPVVALYEKNTERPTIRHAPGLSDLEDQLTQWSPEERWSPDRLDAMVYAVRHLAGHRISATVASPVDIMPTAPAVRLPSFGANRKVG